DTCHRCLADVRQQCLSAFTITTRKLTTIGDVIEQNATGHSSSAYYEEDFESTAAKMASWRRIELRPRLRDFRCSRFGCTPRLLRPKVVFGQVFLQELKSFFRRVNDLEQIKILLRDHARIGHRLKVNDLGPVLTAINHYKDLLCQLLCLREREDLEEFVHRAKPSGKYHQRLCQISEPELP